MCVYAWYSNTPKSYASRRMTYSQTRIWIPSFTSVIVLAIRKINQERNHRSEYDLIVGTEGFINHTSLHVVESRVYRILPNERSERLKMWKGGRLLEMGEFHVDSAKTLVFFLKYGDVVTLQVPSMHRGLVDYKVFVNISLRQNLRWFNI